MVPNSFSKKARTDSHTTRYPRELGVQLMLHWRSIPHGAIVALEDFGFSLWGFLV
jgi:hypothetical protein